LINNLSQLEGVASHIVSQSILVETEFGPMRLLAVESASRDDKSPPLLLSMPNAIERFLQGQGVLISEPLAYHQNLAPGDRITVQTEQGNTKLVVLGILQDYSSSRGRIFINLGLYRQLWRDSTVSGLTLYRTSGFSQQKLLQSIQRYLTKQPIIYNVSSRSEIREITLTVFDRTFAITHVLRTLAILVAFVGVLSALLALQLEGLREFAILRATGMTPRQLTAMILLQTGLMGLLAGLLALPLGLLMSDVLMDVINRSSFGWSMQHLTPRGVLLEAVLLAVGAALIAGTYPAWRAARIAPAQALREE
jgi:putative ABC transport system permease protein